MRRESQIQALERTQPGLPLGLGHIATQTHDYYRHGTVTLFAALDYVSGKVITQTHERHRHQEWIKFLTAIDQQTPPDLALHIICDNYATHKHPKVKAWLEKHPRFHIHFTPTSSSWLNLVERFFRDLTQNAVREFSQPPHRGHDPGDGIRWPGVGAHAPSKFPIVYVTEGKAFSQQLNVAGATSYADATPPE